VGHLRGNTRHRGTDARIHIKDKDEGYSRKKSVNQFLVNEEFRWSLIIRLHYVIEIDFYLGSADAVSGPFLTYKLGGGGQMPPPSPPLVIGGKNPFFLNL
jgi:hypothetical protein